MLLPLEYYSDNKKPFPKLAFCGAREPRPSLVVSDR